MLSSQQIDVSRPSEIVAKVATDRCRRGGGSHTLTAPRERRRKDSQRRGPGPLLPRDLRPLPLTRRPLPQTRASPVAHRSMIRALIKTARLLSTQAKKMGSGRWGQPRRLHGTDHRCIANVRTWSLIPITFCPPHVSWPESTSSATSCYWHGHTL